MTTDRYHRDEDAPRAYAAAEHAIRADLAEIGQLLDRHARRARQAAAAGDGIWDHVGDLGHVQELTAQIGAFLADGDYTETRSTNA